MSRVTVRWLHGAEDDLARLWLDGDDRQSLEAAANEIDQILRVDPSRKGRPHGLAQLDSATIDSILRRANTLPEDLRWLRCGPLEVFFMPYEADAMALVLHVRLRPDK